MIATAEVHGAHVDNRGGEPDLAKLRVAPVE